MGDIPYHHRGIPCQVAEERLTGDLGNEGQEKIGRFLLRSSGGDDIISYVTKGLSVKHHIVPKKKSHNLLKHHPNLTTLRMKIDFLINLPNMRFVYPVTPEDFPVTDVIDNKMRIENTCHVCEHECADDKALKYHLQSHQISFCNACEDIYPMNSSVDHKIRCSLSPVLYYCAQAQCNFETRYKRALKEHIDAFHGPDSHTCETCQKTFSSLDKYENHRSSAHGFSFKCHHCDKEYETRQGRNKHIRTHHKDLCQAQATVVTPRSGPVPAPASENSPASASERCSASIRTRSSPAPISESCLVSSPTSSLASATRSSLSSTPRNNLASAPTSSPAPASENSLASATRSSPSSTPENSPASAPTSYPAPASENSLASATSSSLAPASESSLAATRCHSASTDDPSPSSSAHVTSGNNGASMPVPSSNPASNPPPPPPQQQPDIASSDEEDTLDDDCGGPQKIYMCHACNFKSKSIKKVRIHYKEKHSDKRSNTEFTCLFCDFSSSYGSSLKRHMRLNCPFTPGKQKRMTEAMLWEAVSDVAISNNTAYTFLTSLSNQVGFKFYPKYLRTVLKNSLNCFRSYLKAETLRFKESDGSQSVEDTTFVYVENLKKMIDDVLRGRGITNPHLNIGVDGGGNKLIIVLQIYDMDQDGAVKEKYKSLGSRRTIVIGRGDYVGENRDNIEYMFKKLKIFETLQQYKSYHIISDLKISNLLSGIGCHSSKHSCYICDGMKIGERWIVGETRTTFTAMRDHNGFMASGADKRIAMDANNQIREPIQLVSDLNKPFYEFITIDPLHIFKLGVINDVYTNLQARFPDQMRKYFIRVKASREKSNMPGLKFNGGQIDHLLKEHNLDLLKDYLAEIGEAELGQATVDYLRCLKRMHTMCVSKTPWLNYEDECREFRRQFDEMLHKYGLVTETVKAHIVYAHLPTVLKFNMENNNVSLFLCDTNGLESCHSALRRSDERHSCKVTHAQGEKIHEELSIRSVSFFNARTLGYLPDRRIPELDDEDQDNPDVTSDWNVDFDLDRGDDQRLVQRVLGGQGPPPSLPGISLDDHIRMRDLSLKKRRPIRGGGDCWWDTLDDLLEIHPVAGVPRGHQSLRSFICDRVMALEMANTWKAMHFGDSISAFREYLDIMKLPGTYTDDYGIITLATSLILGNIDIDLIIGLDYN